MPRYLVIVDIAMRSADREKARATFVTYLHGLGLEPGQTIETSGYQKGDVNSRVHSVAAIQALDFPGVAERMRRLDTTIFGGSPSIPSRYFRYWENDPASVEIVGPSPDDPIAHPEVVWMNIEAEDSEAWEVRLAPLFDEDRSSDRDDHFRR